jgi:hypothetical protein
MRPFESGVSSGPMHIVRAPYFLQKYKKIRETNKYHEHMVIIFAQIEISDKFITLCIRYGTKCSPKGAQTWPEQQI